MTIRRFQFFFILAFIAASAIFTILAMEGDLNRYQNEVTAIAFFCGLPVAVSFAADRLMETTISLDLLTIFAAAALGYSGVVFLEQLCHGIEAALAESGKQLFINIGAVWLAWLVVAILVQMNQIAKDRNFFL